MLHRLTKLLANTHDLVPGVVRSGQPFCRFFWDLLFRVYAFSAVLNLRGSNDPKRWYQTELDVCAARGCLHHDVRLSSKRIPDQASILNVIAALETLPRPLLIKCAGGSDRTGLTSALVFLMRDGQGGLPQARAQLRLFPYLYRHNQNQRWIRSFLDYYEATTAPDETVKAWIMRCYTVEAFEAYLADRRTAA